MAQLELKRFKRYTQNLGWTTKPAWSLPSNHGPEQYHIYSYDTLVAIQNGRRLVELGYWSVTTSKHVAYAAQQFDLTLEKFQR